MVKEQIRRIGDLGLTVNISEMDVRITQLPQNVQQIAQKHGSCGFASYFVGEAVLG